MDSKMDAIVCSKPGNLYREKKAIPQPRSGEVLLRVHALGICGSDIHAFHGNQPMFSYPQVMGHEISAEVVQCGESVNDLLPGQQVVVIPYRNCGECIACRRGRSTCCKNLSVMGVHSAGAMQEYVTVSAEYIVPLEGISHADAALIEPYSISAHAVHRSGVKDGEWILVVGAGAIGLGAADISRALGANVILADGNDYRLNSAKSNYGFEHCLNPFRSDYRDEINRITNGDGPTTIIDATGNAASMNSSVDIVAASGTIVFVGLHSGDICINDLAFHKRETTLLASRAASRQDFELVIDLVQKGKLRISCLRSRTVNFSEIDQALFKELTSPEIVKSVVLF